MGSSSPSPSPSPSPDQVVTLRTHGRVAIITINNPQKLNAMRQSDTFRLSCLLREVADMPHITVTILTGTGRFFSAGGDVSAPRPVGKSHEARRQILTSFVANTHDITRCCYTHPKILVAALNGPVVGLHAGLLGFADFVYATPHTYLLTPFSSLGLATEGGASIGFVQRLGLPLANEALLMGRKISSERLAQCGFITKMFRGQSEEDSVGFLEQVIEEVNDRLGQHLNQESLLKIKKLIRRPFLEMLEAQGVREVVEGMQRFADGAPQREFRRIAAGGKRHRL